MAPAARSFSRVSSGDYQSRDESRSKISSSDAANIEVPTSLEQMTEDLPKLRQAVMLLAGDP